jgi:HNH endonuclease
MTNQNECEVEGCAKPNEKYRKMCAMHRSRLYVYGDLHYRRPSTLAERFAVKVPSRVEGECWHFMGTITSGGYGLITDFDKNRMAHRVAYEMWVGPIPDGMDVDHICHNEAYAKGECLGGSGCLHRRCCNPDHLEAVTSGTNTRRGGSPSAVLARLRQGVTCPCGCGHTFDPTALEAAMVVSYDQPE